MNRKKETYDRLSVGERIREKRLLLDMSQDELATKIDRAPKYCSDIERGICGMSVETMLALSDSLDMSLDYMILGKISDAESNYQNNTLDAIVHLLSTCPEIQQERLLQIIKIFISSI